MVWRKSGNHAPWERAQSLRTQLKTQASWVKLCIIIENHLPEIVAFNYNLYNIII